MRLDVKFRFVNRIRDTGEIRFIYTNLDEIENEDSWQGRVNYRRLGIDLFTGLYDKNGKGGGKMNPHSHSYLFRRGEERHEEVLYCDNCRGDEEADYWCETCNKHFCNKCFWAWDCDPHHHEYYEVDRYNPDDDYNHDIDDRVI